MISELRTVDSAGQILRAGGRGVGFSLSPAFDSRQPAGRPGSFPVRVRLLPSGELLEVPNADAYYIGRGFQSLMKVHVAPASSLRYTPALRTMYAVLAL